MEEEIYIKIGDHYVPEEFYERAFNDYINEQYSDFLSELTQQEYLEEISKK